MGRQKLRQRVRLQRRADSADRKGTPAAPRPIRLRQSTPSRPPEQIEARCYPAPPAVPDLTPLAQLQRMMAGRGMAVQAQLRVTPAGDAHEQEADRVAARVVSHLQGVQRQEVEEEEGLQAKRLDVSFTPVRRQELDEEEVSMKAGGPDAVVGREGGDLDNKTAGAIRAAKGGGQPLGEGVRGPLEQAFGTDFGGVRVHHDARSDQLNRQIQARAFTTGRDIFFRQGEYHPGDTAGQELLAHELTHVVQQGGAGSTADSEEAGVGQRVDREVIQRKVGFELESNAWYAWKYLGKGTPPARATVEGAVPVRPAKRQVEPLHVDPDFELQADDTPGPEASTLEFVTEPMETETNDLPRLAELFKRINTIVEALDKHPDRHRAAEKAEDQFIFPEELATNRAGFLVSSIEGKKTQFKMQATAGIRLADLPQIMSYFSHTVTGESEQEQQERAPARAMIQPNKRVDESLGKAAGWAAAAAREIGMAYVQKQMRTVHGARQNPMGAHRGAGIANPFEGDTSNLVGFLAISMAYLNNMALASGELMKYWQPFMARNNFADMYAQVPAAQRMVLQADPGLLVDPVIKVLNRDAGLSLTRGSQVANKAYVKEPNPDPEAVNQYVKPKVMQDLTVFRWLGAIARGGRDFMQASEVGKLLRHAARQRGEQTDTQEFATSTERHRDYLESVGINAPDASSQGDALFLFENRSIINAFEGGNQVTLDQARAMAFSYLLFFHKLEKVRAQGKGFGQFPRF